MLRKDKKNKNDHPSAPGKFHELKNFSKDLSQKKSNEKTIIGENITIEGDIRGQEHLVIEGSVKGNVELEEHNFALGSKGRVEGKIHAQNISISGQMIGNIKTQGKVEITEDADFLGEIHARSISVQNGAYFSGSVKLNREPDRKTSLTKTSTRMSYPQPSEENDLPPVKEASKKN